MRKTLILLLAIATLSMGLRAQSNYNDFRKSEKILEDNFDSSVPGWALMDFDVSDGWLRYTKRKGLALIPIQVDQDRDFEMETYAKVNPGNNPDIIFGDYSALFTLSYDNGLSKPPVGCLYLYQDRRPGFRHMPEPKYQVSGRKDIPESEFYLLTFRKIGSRLYLYINREFIAQAPFRTFINSKVGVWGQVNSDFITVSYIEKADPEAIMPTVLVSRTEPEPEVELASGIKPGGKYFGLIVGVSEYKDPKLNLTEAVKDARKMKEILVRDYSFEETTTFLLLNPTRQKLLSELFRLRKVVGPNDNLLIFYAGHGYWDEAARQGYWWGSDANEADPSAWLSNSDMREQIRSIKSGHTLLISDACFSGGIFKTRSGSIKDASLDLQILYRIPSRRAITSGTMTTVPDQSVFFEYLSKRLVENQKPFLSSQQLFDSFRLAIINNSMIVPQDGVIAETGDEGGDFIFIRR